MNQTGCEKIVLADAMGLRLIYCRDCNVVEFEIGAVSLRLCPDVVQRMANMLMKASLKLDRLTPTSSEAHELSETHVMH
ncbi:MAG TPA: hypothetical protein VJB68_01715 [Methylophilaceae bacterium]|nr:hypothetical protein [Methylophilaceae bacterium]